MAKTVFSSTYYGLVFGHGVNTTVVSASHIPGGSHYEGDPPVLVQDPPIGVKVYPASIAGIEFSSVLEIGGYGQILVSGVGSDEGGAYFTYGSDSEPLPATGAYVRSPWSWVGSDLYARTSGNSITLQYTQTVEHDLYVETVVATTCGQIHAYLDSSDLGLFNCYDPDVNGHPQSFLLASNVAPGWHTIQIVAEGISPSGSYNFVYFRSFSLFEHVPETGGEYPYNGPDGTLEQSTNNFVGTWAVVGGAVPQAYTITQDDAVIFYPQLDVGGKVTFRTISGPSQAIVALYVDNVYVRDIDLYSDPATFPEPTLLDTAAGDAVGLHKIELRHTGTGNPSASGPPYFFYLHSVVVYFSRTDAQAWKLAADFIKALQNSDGAIPDALYASYYNFEAQSVLASCGLLAAYQVLNDASYLDVVKKFLLWLAGLLVENPNDPFADGYWEGAYKQDGPGQYSNGIPLTVNDIYGISQTRWQDSSLLLPAFLLWWYWKLSGDNTTLATCLPKFRKAVDGVIRNSYDPKSGFTFGGWQYFSRPTMFLYHDGIRRYSGAGTLLEQRDDLDNFFTYDPVYWSSFAAEGALNNGAHYTLHTGSYTEFELTLNAGDQLKWLTITAWNVCIANISVSTDGGSTWNPVGTVDGFTADIEVGREFLIYTAPSTSTYRFRIEHSGTINPAGNTATGWQRFDGRQTADQGDTILGLTAMWMMTRAAKYATLAARAVRRLPKKLWDAAHSRWSIQLSGDPPVMDNTIFYAFAQEYVPWATIWSRLFWPKQRLADGLAAMEPYQDSEGGFLLPGYSEPIYADSSGYVLGENQLAAPTNPSKFDLAKSFIKAGQAFLNINAMQVGPVAFSKRYPYYYTVYAGMACLAFSGVDNPITEQLKFSKSKVIP